MSARLVHMGFGNYLSTEKIVAVVVPRSAPVKRAVQGARVKGLIIDMTDGRRTKAVIFTDSNYLVLSALEPVTIDGRLEGK